MRLSCCLFLVGTLFVFFAEASGCSSNGCAEANDDCGVMVTPLCTPNTSSCRDPMTLAICNSTGSSVSTTTCPAGTVCTQLDNDHGDCRVSQRPDAGQPEAGSPDAHP
jgi:hypothetical protein